MTKVFIDGSAGTTGLRIHERLAERKDLELLILPDAIRKDIDARKDAINRADIAFLCLPDAAAIEAVSLVENPHTKIIDTSTAHRTDDGWAYGFSELQGRREAIVSSHRIANPGCHATGFIALVEPLIRAGALSPDALLSSFSLTGYSGGGKSMIAEYESRDRSALLDAPRMYGVTQEHKHLKEMVKICGMNQKPVFCPIVAPYYSGMEVTVALFAHQCNASKKEIEAIYRNAFQTGLVRFREDATESGFCSAGAFSGRDDMEITVVGNEERMVLVARFDNLGKGASGAAIQNMNLILGVDETTGLNVKGDF